MPRLKNTDLNSGHPYENIVITVPINYVLFAFGMIDVTDQYFSSLLMWPESHINYNFI